MSSAATYQTSQIFCRCQVLPRSLRIFTSFEHHNYQVPRYIHYGTSRTRSIQHPSSRTPVSATSEVRSSSTQYLAVCTPAARLHSLHPRIDFVLSGLISTQCVTLVGTWDNRYLRRAGYAIYTPDPCFDCATLEGFRLAFCEGVGGWKSMLSTWKLWDRWG
jgi:hypothetical protein